MPLSYDVFIQRFEQLVLRIKGYPRQEMILELLLFWVAFYVVLRYLRGTRGARAIQGLALILIAATVVVSVLTANDAFERLGFIFGHFLTLAALTLLIVFAPELRRALVRLGEARLFRGPGLRRSRIISAIVGAVAYLSKNKIGGLIALERGVGLKGVVETGIEIDAAVTKELLNTIFWPGSALHDMGVIVRDGRIVAAGVQFPLAEGEQFGTELGSRHRAAIGLSQESDALVVVVSEETGVISLAERGRLIRDLTPEDLGRRLTQGLGRKALDDETEAGREGVPSGEG